MTDFFAHLGPYWAEIAQKPWAALMVIANLVVIESLLSVDNAAVLATMVMDLPNEQRKKALRYGMWGAYVFRGLAMVFASILIKIWWLKPLGGLYLLYLAFDYFKGKSTPETEDDVIDKKSNWLYKATVGWMGTFWATVCLVELMDMAFSIDNVFAAVAFSDNIILVCLGVFIGILAMRFVAQSFVKAMEKYPFLETSAFVVIAILGTKLMLSVLEHFAPKSGFSIFLASHTADIVVSLLTVLVFVVPVLFVRAKEKKINQ
jgi:YkoY family integral membrane protein